MKIYTASSWRNSYYQSVVDFIRGQELQRIAHEFLYQKLGVVK